MSGYIGANTIEKTYHRDQHRFNFIRERQSEIEGLREQEKNIYLLDKYRFYCQDILGRTHRENIL